jgi:hypothetical protein
MSLTSQQRRQTSSHSTDEDDAPAHAQVLEVPRDRDDDDVEEEEDEAETSQAAARRQPTTESTPGTEGYPSWLPRRPPPPEPASTLHSGGPPATPGLRPASPDPYVVGRKPTPRSVRVVRMQDTPTADSYGRRIPTDATRVAGASSAAGQRVWSRATSAGLASMLAASNNPTFRPRFRSKALHLELLRNPTLWTRIYFILLPFFTFYHIFVQSFLDFNAVFILIQ